MTGTAAALVDQRLLEVSRVLLDPAQRATLLAGWQDDGNATGAGPRLLPALVRAARGPDRSPLWLLLAGLAGALPTSDEVMRAWRALDLHDGSTAELELLDVALEAGARSGAQAPVRVVEHSVLVDVDFCATSDVHTGIQRVVRETVPRWAARHAVLPVGWTADRTALRELRSHESRRVLTFRGDHDPDAPDQDGNEPAVLLPWRSTLLLPEVPGHGVTRALAALAEHSGNRVGAIGYDMIPVVSADARPFRDAVGFTGYLDVIKHTDVVATISLSSRQEFTGFGQALAAQGLAGPEVVEVQLPTADPRQDDAGPTPSDADSRPDGTRTVVLSVGTHEPHKNHRTLVFAAEQLWREGMDFELWFIGGPGWRAGTHGMCYDHALAAGRPVRDLGRVDDATLSDALRRASFTVFLSLHEGYGLPVAESLAAGTPALVSDFGSLAEIAQNGGCLEVDPRDDSAVTAAMRRLLTEPDLLASLRSQASARPARSWDDYAAELWAVLVGTR